MTLRDDERGRGRSEEEVDVSPGVPTDRVRWGPILAGTFAALTALAVLATFGAAVGLSTFDRGQDNPRHFALGYGIWSIVSIILAFGFGGWLTARVAALRGRDSGLLNGMIVAAFGLPLLMFLVGSAGAMVGQAELASSDAQARLRSGGMYDNSAVTAGSRIAGDNVARDNVSSTNSAAAVDRENARRSASRAAWGSLIAMVLAIGAASFGGYLGAREGSDDWRRHRRAGSSDRPMTPGV